jgi:hypothetical protein
VSLLAERNILRDRATNLESELAKVKADVAADDATLKAKIASAEARVVDDVAAAEKHLIEFEAELTEDLANLREVYKRNVESIGGLCSPVPEDDPSSVITCAGLIRRLIHYLWCYHASMKISFLLRFRVSS